MHKSREEDAWIEELRDYCRELNIETSDLYKILTDLKVAPMIRGKAFEFSVSLRLSQLLSPAKWTVSKPMMNAQSDSHDVDVKVQHQRTGKVIRVECKLASKGGFKVLGDDEYLIPVKCMRSRTTKTPAKVERAARQLGVSSESFLAHSDQYRVNSFDVVATSLGNAFYQTDQATKTYRFQPSAAGIEFLNRLKPPPDMDLQSYVYKKVYLAKSSDLAVSRHSGVICGKRACLRKDACGFIPNYPSIKFGRSEENNLDNPLAPLNRWIEIEEVEHLFQELIGNLEYH